MFCITGVAFGRGGAALTCWGYPRRRNGTEPQPPPDITAVLRYPVGPLQKISITFADGFRFVAYGKYAAPHCLPGNAMHQLLAYARQKHPCAAVAQAAVCPQQHERRQSHPQ